MSDLENANSVFDISVKLCSAIEKHKCLYDRNSVRKMSTPEYEKAWLEVAKECNQTADYCRNRWKNLLKAFYQGIKRRGNPYYLHEYMTFLLEGEGSKSKTKRQPEAVLNDETNSTTTHEESVVHVEDGAADESDTNSADESNEQIKVNNSQTGGGIFIIDELGEEVGEGENRDRRLSYKRNCKRGLDPELLGDLGDEDSQEPEGKRTRRVMAKEGGKRLDDNDSGLLPNKKVVVRVDKIKINKSLKDNKAPAEVEDMWSKKIKEAVNCNESLYTETKPSTPKLVKMVDSSTSTTVTTRCVATQYETSTDNMDYDEIFMQSIKQRLQEMNPRQKMNFKAKMYQSLMEVFDDSKDFPGSNEVLQLPANKPRVVNTTTGELRLMRELVSLVQAAKNTPEIVNAKEKVKTTTAPAPSAAPPAPAASKTPNKLPVANNIDHNSKAAQNSPLSLSPTLDDDDFQFCLDNIDDDEDLDLPRTWEEIKAKTTPEPAKTAAAAVEENVMGLPRRILQKVVRVSGTSGSTIVARDGDKKRIYRIYPKSMNPNGVISPAMANKNTNKGTFYVTPAKGPGETITASNANKNLSNMPNITIRSFNTNNKTSAVTPNTDTMTSASNSNESSATNPANQTAFKNIHPANRILSATTGFFKTVPSPKPVSNPTMQRTPNVHTTTNFPSSTVTKVTAVAKNSMLPPTLANLTTKRTLVRSHINSPQLMQRRYSICGPLPAEKPQNTPPPTMAGSATTTKGPNNSSQMQTPTSVSQIQISQPVSLNSKAAPSTPNTNTPNIRPIMQTKTETDFSAPVADIKISFREPQPAAATSAGNNAKTTTTPTEEIPILETAGTVGVDVLDPLFVKQTHIKSEPSDD